MDKRSGRLRLFGNMAGQPLGVRSYAGHTDKGIRHHLGLVTGAMKPVESKMAWRSRAVARLKCVYGDLRDIARHEGAATAAKVLALRFFLPLRFRLGATIGRIRSARNPNRPPGASILLPTASVEPGILFVGYVEAALGLGVSLRGLIDSAAMTDLPFAIFPYNVNVESRYLGPFRPERYDLGRPYEFNLIETAVDQLPILLDHLGDVRIESGYNILRTYWELPTAPEQWRPHLAAIDEIWAPNAFVADAFRPIFSRPILIVPPAVEDGDQSLLPRSALGLNDGVFYFLFTFDYFSFPARKNPLAVLRAFQAAFPRGDQRVGLIIKSTGAQGHFAEMRAVIASAARKDPRIVVIDRTMTQQEIFSLVSACNCYVSLHRSEGFGLGMVEAILAGKPVIGTDFSGSTDFLSDDTGYPIPYRLRPVQSREYLYPEGQVWAEPDVDAAVAAMRAVLTDDQAAARKAAKGQAFVRQRYSRSSVAQIVSARIQAIRDRGGP
ncbi:MAG: glycosyltransferase family 4 protein [Rhizobiales bacterium]|nr:glycosyltransferase family 4 protein [Hyphomicrobiales bacterium]